MWTSDSSRPQSWPLLLMACWYGNAAVLDVLLKAGAPVDATAGNGFNCFVAVAANGIISPSEMLAAFKVGACAK